jgi:hypothetical protein
MGYTPLPYFTQHIIHNAEADPILVNTLAFINVFKMLLSESL